MADCLEEALGQKAAVDLSDADWADSRALVESHQPASHERSVGGPGRRLIGQPFGDAGHHVSKELGLLAKAQEPVPQVDGVCAAWPGCSRELRRHPFHDVSSDLDWDG